MAEYDTLTSVNSPANHEPSRNVAPVNNLSAEPYSPITQSEEPNSSDLASPFRIEEDSSAPRGGQEPARDVAPGADLSQNPADAVQPAAESSFGSTTSPLESEIDLDGRRADQEPTASAAADGMSADPYSMMSPNKEPNSSVATMPFRNEAGFNTPLAGQEPSRNAAAVAKLSAEPYSPITRSEEPNSSVVVSPFRSEEASSAPPDGQELARDVAPGADLSQDPADPVQPAAETLIVSLGRQSNSGIATSPLAGITTSPLESEFDLGDRRSDQKPPASDAAADDLSAEPYSPTSPNKEPSSSVATLPFRSEADFNVPLAGQEPSQGAAPAGSLSTEPYSLISPSEELNTQVATSASRSEADLVAAPGDKERPRTGSLSEEPYSLISQSEELSPSVVVSPFQSEDDSSAPRGDPQSAADAAPADPSQHPAHEVQPAAETLIVSPGFEKLVVVDKPDEPDAPERALVAKAHQAIKEANYLSAAELFLDATKLNPRRVDYVLMRGHCLKDGADYLGAFRCYLNALGADPSSDAQIQLGHLFKITGNLREAKLAYRRSADTGNASAQLELQNFESMSASQLRFLATTGGNDLAADTFWNVVACEREDAFDYRAVANAARFLALEDAPDIAKAYFEVAYLTDDSGSHQQQHYSIVRHHAFWSPIHLSELARSDAVRSGQRTASRNVRLQKLIGATLAGQDGDDSLDAAWTAVARARARGVDRPPEVLMADACEALLTKLMVAVDRTYHAFFVQTPFSGVTAIEAVRALAEATYPSDRLVTFPTSSDASGLRLLAARILNAVVRSWLHKARTRFLLPSVRPEQIETEQSLGGNPLRDLVEEFGSAAALFDQAQAHLSSSGKVGGARNDLLDDSFAPLLSKGASTLSEEQVEEILREAIKRNLPKSRAVLARSLAESGASSKKIIEWAQDIKHAGDAEFAYNLMKYSQDEADASREYLVEMALLAKIVGDFKNSARLLEMVAATAPEDEFARRELVAILPEVESISSILYRFRADPLFLSAARERWAFRVALSEEPISIDEAFLDDKTRILDLAPQAASEFAAHAEEPPREEIRILEIGQERRAGLRRELVVLRACDFVRVRVQSRKEIIKMRARIDGKTISVTTPSGLASKEPGDPIRAWIANCWMDLSATTPGAHELQLYFEERASGYRSIELPVWIDLTPATPEMSLNAAVVDLPPDTKGLSVDDRVNRLPSLVLRAEQTLFQGAIDNVLVMRADQLGDVVLSVPAMYALKDLFPNAELTCLATPSNRELLMSMGLFREVLTVDLTYDPVARRRYASLAEQLRLKKTLQPKRFDLAIDLQPSSETRPLLRLVGARYTAGFSPAEFPWLSVGVDLHTREPGSNREASLHSVRPITLVEALARVLSHRFVSVASPNADRKLLEGLGLDVNLPFAALHSGARKVSHKWALANYLSLAEKLIKDYGIQVALLVDTAADLEGVDASVLHQPGLGVIARPLPFPQLDALVSLCSVYVGNDTGPKHLASLRGAPVVSVHIGTFNWREWGQETGFIVTRRTPCYGCGIEAAEDCGKGLPCLGNITVDEVYGAVRRALAERNPSIEMDPGEPALQ